MQVEVGSPVPGTYRHDFMNDTEPRRAGDMRHLVALIGRTEKEDVAAMEVVTQLMPGELRDMSCWPAPVDGGRPPSVLEAASGGG